MLMMDPVSSKDILSMSPMELVLNGIQDPIGVFIKGDPHPLRKLKTKAYRCICPVSLADQQVESFLFDSSSSYLKSQGMLTGSAVGISFTDEKLSEFYGFVTSLVERYGPAVFDDCSGFDALHTPQIYRATARVDELVHGMVGERFNAANLAWCHKASYGVYIFTDTLYELEVPGMMDSGKRDTSRRNTCVRGLLSTYLCILSNQDPKFVIANGDDGGTWGIHDLDAYKSAALQSGITLRDVVQSSDTFEFCSHKYSRQNGIVRAPLVSWSKAIYSAMCKPAMTQTDAYQIAHECRHNTVGDLNIRIKRYLDAIIPCPDLVFGQN
jgi:hypothetical protein